MIGPLGAQSLSWGVKGGIPLTDAVEGSFGVRWEAKRYTAGPTVEIGLTGPFACEVDALYHLSGGYAVRSLTGAEAVSHNFGGDIVTGAPIDSTFRGAEPLSANPTHGVVVGAGLRLNAGLIRIAPEIRYTRWRGRPIDDQGWRGFFARSTQNQVDLLIGLTF